MKKVMNEEIKYYDNFNIFLQGIREDYGDRDAVAWYDRKGQEYKKSYREFAADVYALADYFIQEGIAGSHVAIIGENSYHWIVVYFAAAVSGGAGVCIDAEQAEDVICQMVEMSESETVFLSKSCLNLCERYGKDHKDRRVILLEGEEDGYQNVQQLIEQMDGTRGEAGCSLNIPPRQTAAIVFTSGTTGISKPVMLSHQALLTNGCECNIYVDAGPRSFSALPLCHTYGMTCAGLASWARGAVLILNGNLKTVMRDLLAADAFSLLTVPLMVEAIHNQIWLKAGQEGKEAALRQALKLEKMKRKLGLKKPGKALTALRKRIVGDLKVIICGGAHMSKEIAEEFELMGLIMLQGYGITECSPLVAVNGNGARKLSSVGMVLPSCQVKLVDEEIYAKGKNLMNGYFNMPEETDEVMDGQWFKTGDIGMIDRDGFLYITGRKKNLVVFKNGKKLSPERLENIIRQIPLVKEVMVYGAASGVTADDVKLAVSIFPDEDYAGAMSSYEILEELQGEIDKLNNTLPLYQQIQMVNIREEDFEKTAMMKIKRHMI